MPSSTSNCERLREGGEAKQKEGGRRNGGGLMRRTGKAERWRWHFDVVGGKGMKVDDKMWWGKQRGGRVHANTITVSNVGKEMTPR